MLHGAGEQCHLDPGRRPLSVGRIAAVKVVLSVGINGAPFDQAGDFIGGKGEAESVEGHVTTSLPFHRVADVGVDAHQTPLTIEEGAAGVARIDGRLVLDGVFPNLADVAGSEGPTEAVGVADRNDFLTHLQSARCVGLDVGVGRCRFR